jgi:hypothetical protein
VGYFTTNPFLGEAPNRKPIKRVRLAQPNFQAIIHTPDSTWVDHIQYDPDKAILEAQTTKGARYRYRNVPALVFAKVVTSTSPGKAFNTLVKGTYRSTKLHR